jgi:hypothetical protein
MGKGRSFWISARGREAPHIPTDLEGINHLVFDRPKGDRIDQLRRALEEPCDRLRSEIEKLGRRTDRAIEEVYTARILCAASSQYSEPKFAKDIEQIQRNFPPGSIRSAHGVNAEELLSFSDRNWDIIHLAMYVDSMRGDLIIPDSSDRLRTSERDRIPVEGVENMIHMSRPRLVVIVTCDSLVLAARIARLTNTIAGHKPISRPGFVNVCARLKASERGQPRARKRRRPPTSRERLSHQNISWAARATGGPPKGTYPVSLHFSDLAPYRKLRGTKRSAVLSFQ